MRGYIMTDEESKNRRNFVDQLEPYQINVSLKTEISLLQIFKH